MNGLERRGSAFAHSTSVIDDPAVLGEGTRVWHFSHVCAGARVGRECSLGQNVFVADGAVLGDRVKVQNNVSVYSGVIVEDEVFLGPSCVLTNVSNPRSAIDRKANYERTRICRGATIGANATVVCGVTIGRHAFVAAGAVVTRSLPDYAFAVGVPARIDGFMSRHGHRVPADAGPEWTCPEGGLRYRLSGPVSMRCLDLHEDEPLPAETGSANRPVPRGPRQ